MTHQELSKFAQWLRRTDCNELVIVSYCGFIKRFENWFCDMWAEPLTSESFEYTNAQQQWHAKRRPEATSSTLARELLILSMFEIWLEHRAVTAAQLAKQSEPMPCAI